jgi:hypothetical protein
MMNDRVRKFVFILIAGTLLISSGCVPAVQENPQTEQETSVEEATEPSVQNNENSAVEAPNVNSLEEQFKAILANNAADLPAVDMKEVAAADTQTELLAQMKSLYDQQAYPREIHQLYIEGIQQLSPEQADRFTAFAIAGLRRNSFADSIDPDAYGGNEPLLDAFFQEAEQAQFRYIALSQNVAAIENEQVRTLIEDAQQQGYYVGSVEGMLFYQVDFTQFATYRKYNTPAMAALIETLAIDDIAPLTNAAYMIEDWSILAARTYGMDLILRTKQGGVYEQFLAERFKNHLVMLFFGTDYSPTYNYESQKILPEVENLLNEMRGIENSLLATLIDQFLILLEQNKGQINDDLRTQANEIFKQIDEMVGITDATSGVYGQWMSGDAAPAVR